MPLTSNSVVLCTRSVAGGQGWWLPGKSVLDFLSFLIVWARRCLSWRNHTWVKSPLERDVCDITRCCSIQEECRLGAAVPPSAQWARGPAHLLGSEEGSAGDTEREGTLWSTGQRGRCTRPLPRVCRQTLSHTHTHTLHL